MPLQSVPSVLLNDGRRMPQLGFGLWQVSQEDAEKSVRHAFRTGYRSIDGAAIYRNEEALGQAIKGCELSRDQIFITTKLWNEDQGLDQARRAFETSLAKLKLDYLDLYLIHWPSPSRKLFVDSWKALVALKKEGRIRSIGVSNFEVEHLEKIIQETGEVPTVNQIELHPYFQQKSLRDFHTTHQIRTESWSPLGQGKILDDETLRQLAAKYQKTPAQIILRWHLDHGLIAIPKSVTPKRIDENFAIFNFELTAEDRGKIDGLDRVQGRIGPDPKTATF